MKSIYMDKRWGILQQFKENGETEIFTFEKNGMKIVYPFIKRKAGVVNHVQYFDLVTPRGECGPWIENGGRELEQTNNLLDDFNEAFNLYCVKENIIAEYIRFSPWLAMSTMFSKIYKIESYGMIFCNDLTIDFFRKEYKSSKRRNVRHAEKNGVKIMIDFDKDFINDFLKLYSFTERKYDVSHYYKLDHNFLKRYTEIFPNETLFAKAIYNGKVISAALILMGENIAHYHFGASDPSYNSLQANSLLFYKTAKFAAQKGREIFDLGSAKPESTLEKFKQGIAKGYRCYVGTKVRNMEIYNLLIEQSGGPRDNYFPAYRRD